MIEEFTLWLVKITPEMKKISAILATELSTEPEQLYSQINILDAQKDRISDACSDAEEWVSISKRFYLEKHLDKKEFEKKINLEADVSRIKKVLTRLEYMRDDMESKIEWGRSALAYQRQLILKSSETRPH